MRSLALILLSALLTGCDQYRKATGTNYKSDDGQYQAPGQAYSGPHAYLLMGQSNMSLECPGYQPNYIGAPGCSTGEALGHVITDANAIFIQCAVGGSHIGEWMPGKPLYEQCLAHIPNGMPIRGMFFFQGESDANINDYDWRTPFTSIVKDLRSRVGNIPVVYGQIGGGRSDPNWLHLQEAQASVTLSRCRMVVTKDLPSMDVVHFTPGAYEIIAQRMASAMENL